jgi:hypothetical protein
LLDRRRLIPIWSGQRRGQSRGTIIDDYWGTFNADSAKIVEVSAPDNLLNRIICFDLCRIHSSWSRICLNRCRIIIDLQRIYINRCRIHINCQMPGSWVWPLVDYATTNLKFFFLSLTEITDTLLITMTNLIRLSPLSNIHIVYTLAISITNCQIQLLMIVRSYK